MPITADEKRLETRASAVIAALTLVCGLVLMYISYDGGWQNSAVETMDHLVKFDSTYMSGTRILQIPTVTTRRIMRSVFWMSVLVVIASVIGVVGSLLRHKGPVCTYVILATGLSLVVLVSSVQTSQRRLLAGPLLMRQANRLCNTSTYLQLSTGLNCNYTAKYDKSEVEPCRELCQFRVNQLRKHNGCHVLPKLCSAFAYEPLKGGGCLEAALDTGMVAYRHKGESMSSDACRASCDNDIGCDTFITLDHTGGETQCVVLSARATFHDPRNWTKFTKGFRKFLARQQNASMQSEGSSVLGKDWTHECHRRTKPQVLLEFMDTGLHLALTTALLAVVLLLSTFCTCCLLYNVNMSRQGLPTALELGLMMLCPCCSAHVHRRFHEDYFDENVKATHMEDDSDEDEDDDDDDSDEECVE